MFNETFRNQQSDAAWTAVGLASAVVGGLAVRNLIKAGWLAYYDEHPPLNPAAPDTSWRQAILFTGVMGAGVGVARMLSRRIAAGAWNKTYGDYPTKLRRDRSVA